MSAIKSAVIEWLRSCGHEGGTVKDLRGLAETHHGKASAVLSRLHREGTIACLIMRRGGCHVYVMPEFVNGRGTIQVRVRQRALPDFEVFIAGYRLALGITPEDINRVEVRSVYNDWLATSKVTS